MVVLLILNHEKTITDILLHDICPVCFWENDVFVTSDDEPSDENHGISLRTAQENYRSFGACARTMLRYVREPKPEEIPQ